MSQKVTGPYGSFNSIADAARIIAHTRGPDFIKQYQNYPFQYDPQKMDKRFNGEGNSVRQYIYDAIADMIGSVPKSQGGSGRRPAKNGWKRV